MINLRREPRSLLTKFRCQINNEIRELERLEQDEIDKVLADLSNKLLSKASWSNRITES